MLEQVYSSKPNENIFFSPISVYSALLLAYYGSAGVTQTELLSTLKLDWADSKEMVRSAYSLQKWYNKKLGSKNALGFASVDRVFLSQNLTTYRCFDERLVNDIIKMDFENNSEKALKDINDWIANVTNDQIREMLSSQEVNERTQVVLANAAYFKGQWVRKFREQFTVAKPFFTSADRSSMVPMMHQRGAFKIKTDNTLDAYILQLPFQTSDSSQNESDVSMVIVLPSFTEDAIPKLLSKLDANRLEKSLKGSVAREVQISIPKFEFEERISLLPVSIT